MSQYTRLSSLLFLTMAAMALPAIAQQELYNVKGGSRGGNLGYGVAALGDVNADGFDDFAVGLYNDSTVGPFAGRIRVYSGQNGALLFSVNGSNGGDSFGYAICGIPDTNADGKDDLLVGAPFADPNGSSSGQVRLLSGASGSTLLTLSGAAAGDQFGRSVAYGGTVGGLRRLVIGAPYRDTGASAAGSAYLYTEAGGLLHEWSGTQASEHLGWSVAGGFDVGTDGTPDVAAGAPDYDDNGDNAGRVKVYSGSSYSTIYTLASAGPGHKFGYSVAMLKDVNNDNRGETLVGAPYFNGDNGAVYVHSGNLGSILFTKLGATDSHFGWSVSTAGDANLDGRTDFFVGAPDDTANGAIGSATLFSGLNGSSLFVFKGAIAGGDFGTAVSGGADMTGDNRGDLVVGTPEAAILCSDQGNVRAFNGSSHAELYEIDGPAYGDNLGYSTCSPGDVNGDGYADFLAGGPLQDHVTLILQGSTLADPDAGVVRCYSGATGALLWSTYGSADGDEFGFSMVKLGDVNGDGKGDFAVGAPQRKTATDQPGYVRICSGANGAALATLTGVAGIDAEFGYALGSLKDNLGDGKPELMIGIPGYDSNRGRAIRVNSAGYSTSNLWYGILAGERFGATLTGTGDTNNDGKYDVVIGAPANDAVAANAGRAYVLSGIANLTISTLSGTQANESFGSSVCNLHFDFYEAFVIGSPGMDYAPSSLTNCGKVTTYFAPSLLPYTTTFGHADYEGLGGSMANIGDYNLDGFDDFAVYGSENALFFGGAGVVRVVSGYYGVEQYEFSTGASFDGHGVGLSGGTDINADGTFDIVVGAPYTDDNGISSGTCRVYSLKPIGVNYFGVSTPGCNGPQTMRVSTSPKLGTNWFIYGVDNVPPNALGLLLVTNSPDNAGSDVFEIGVQLYVDFFAATEVYGLDIQGIGEGHALAVTPIGVNPATIGLTYYTQSIWAWGSCALPPFNLSASTAASITIQP